MPRTRNSEVAAAFAYGPRSTTSTHLTPVLSFSSLTSPSQHLTSLPDPNGSRSPPRGPASVSTLDKDKGRFPLTDLDELLIQQDFRQEEGESSSTAIAQMNPPEFNSKAISESPLTGSGRNTSESRIDLVAKQEKECSLVLPIILYACCMTSVDL
jgi:hypothetical protein